MTHQQYRTLPNVPFQLNPLRWRRYDTRVTVFLDVLGFSNLIRESESNPVLVDQIGTALEYLTKVVPSWFDPDVEAQMLAEASKEGLADDAARKVLQLCASNNRISWFSDNVVISGSDDVSGLLFSLFSAARVTLCCLQLGFPVRGGIAIGPLKHNAHVIFGPALVAAYEIESRIAESARVVIDQEAADRIRAVGDPYSTGFDPASLLATDEDGRQILDFLSTTALETAGLGATETLVKHVRELIVQRLQGSAGSHAARAKIGGLARYFNRKAAGRYGALPITDV